jgi:hypothetical protein
LEQTGTLVFEKKGTCDKLIGTIEGFAEPNHPEYLFIGYGEYEITSGTGKFEGVKGRGTYKFFVLPDMVGECTFEGTLTFPANN